MTHSTSTCCGTGKPRVRSGFVPPAHRLGVKERWEAGPPRCLLRRVGLVPTSVNFEGLTEWVWCPPAGGLKSGGPTALPPPSIPAKVPRGPWDRRQLLHVRHEEVFRMTASFTEQMMTIYTHLGMLSRGKLSLSLTFFVTLTKVKVQLWAAAAGSEAFAGITMGDP